MHNYEIEIKSLLGSKENADEFRRRLQKHFSLFKTLPKHKQLNHYFNPPKDLRALERAVASLYSSKEKRMELSRILKNAKGKVSVRTREADGKVSFILKASIGDDSSANGVSRIEFECVIASVANRRDGGATNAAHTNERKVSRPQTLEELDQKLLDAGLTYEAKWSREREEYVSNNTHITIDKNAGYGYLAEFEQVVDDEEKADEVKRELSELMNDLGVSELPQERLERMFKFYNEHWEEYYGTERMFVIE